MTDNALLRAFDQFRAGQLGDAAKLLRAHLSAAPFDAAANHLLGGIYYQQGRLNQAREHFARACAASEATPEMFNNYGAALKAVGDQAGAMAAYQQALALDADYADALSNLGVIYIERREPRKAIEVLRRAVALKPELTSAQLNLRNAYRDVVPPWHFGMMNDGVRNTAYQDAIARAVPGKHVLDIGTGSGLLAMMAARAGAASVTSCEATPVIAEHAREIVARNGLADRVKVIIKHSTGLAIGQDLPFRAQVLITETFSSDLLSEGVLAAVEHAHRELLATEAVTIPRRASGMAYIAGGPEIEAMLFAGRTNGFDLSQFNDFAPPVYATTLDKTRHDVLSDDFELFAFELGSNSFPISSRNLSIPIIRSGVASVVVQWIALELDEISRYENRPSSDPWAENHWTQILYRLPRLMTVQAGSFLNLAIGHNRRQFWISPTDCP